MMKSTSIRSILDELPTDIRNILTQHAANQEEDIDTLIKGWITSAAEQLTLPPPEESSPPDKSETAA